MLLWVFCCLWHLVDQPQLSDVLGRIAIRIGLHARRGATSNCFIRDPGLRSNIIRSPTHVTDHRNSSFTHSRVTRPRGIGSRVPPNKSTRSRFIRCKFTRRVFVW